MKLIFENGEKLYSKEKSLSNQYSDMLENMCGIKLYTYQKTFLDLIIESSESDYCIYGDDFRVDVIPSNIERQCVLSIRDYDENQKFEYEINIDFNKDELDQFINLLQIAKNKMR